MSRRRFLDQGEGADGGGGGQGGGGKFADPVAVGSAFGEEGGEGGLVGAFEAFDQKSEYGCHRPIEEGTIGNNWSARQISPEETDSSARNTMQNPLELAEAVAALRLTPKADQRLQKLMNRNTTGLLTDSEREELDALAEMSENIALVRAKALLFLGRKPA